LHVYLSIYCSEQLLKEDLQVSPFLSVFKQAISTPILKSPNVEQWVLRYVRIDPILAEQSLAQLVPSDFKNKFNDAIHERRRSILNSYS
jgi:hypothetical protein